jgi:hypothetical protein
VRDPHQNIFFYYRGPSKRDKESLYDLQVEDNTTKGLVNILEFCCRAGFVDLLSGFLKAVKVPNRQVVSFKLQKGLSGSRPDALIDLGDYNIHIESKVRARLDFDQIRRHLSDIGTKDFLVVITNTSDDEDSLSKIGDNRIRYLSWSKVHEICLNTVKKIKGNKSQSAVAQLIEQFIDYLEVVVMTEFNGFKDSDFDFWIDPNPYYVPILRKKLEALANIIKEKLPEEIGSEYSFIKPGKISRSGKDERFAWVAIKRPKDDKDVFNQCNFTIEVSKSGLDINTVVRNGRTFQSDTPIGIFFNRISSDTNKFLQVISGARKESRLVISRRLPRTGKRIMPGNEKWIKFFEMKLSDINTQKDVQYICEVLKKADKEPGAPGIHFKYSIDRGTKVLTEPEKLEDEIISTIKKFKPILDFLKGKEV